VLKLRLNPGPWATNKACKKATKGQILKKTGASFIFSQMKKIFTKFNPKLKVAQRIQVLLVFQRNLNLRPNEY